MNSALQPTLVRQHVPKPACNVLLLKINLLQLSNFYFFSCRFHQILHSEDLFQDYHEADSPKSCLQATTLNHLSEHLEMEIRFLTVCKPYSNRNSNGNSMVLRMSDTARNTNVLIKTCREANLIRVNFARSCSESTHGH